MWLDKIIEVNPYSVPGWWRTALYWEMWEDTAAAIKAYDKAQECLNKKLDPCIPDLGKEPLREFEVMYLEFIETGIKRGRARLGY
jgi:hypothetical protein